MDRRSVVTTHRKTVRRDPGSQPVMKMKKKMKMDIQMLKAAKIAANIPFVFQTQPSFAIVYTVIAVVRLWSLISAVYLFFGSVSCHF